MRGLHKEIYNSRHYSDGVFYEWTGSLPSGHPWTVILNSIYVCICMRIAWVSSGHKLTDFKKYVTLISYGDDSIMSVSPDVIDTFNQNVLTTELLKVGLVYTDEAKTTGLVPKYRTIEEVSFLKRDFRAHNELGMIVGGLELGTILEMPLWYARQRPKDENLKERCDEALIELYVRGPADWDLYAEHIIKAYEDLFSLHLTYTTPSLCHSAILSRYN
jgi:hypothetical protein